MLVLTNSVDQTLNPGQSATFDTVIMHTGCGEYFRPASGAVKLKSKQGLYEIDFAANIGATDPGAAQIAILYDGSPMLETTMISQTATAGDLNNVSTHALIKTCCCDNGAVTIANTGTTPITIGVNPSFIIKRSA